MNKPTFASAAITRESFTSNFLFWRTALPTLLLTIKRHLHILRHAKHHWQIPLRAEKSPRCDRTAMIRGFSRPILNS